MKKATYFYGIWCQNGIPFLAPYSAKTELRFWHHMVPHGASWCQKVPKRGTLFYQASLNQTFFFRFLKPTVALLRTNLFIVVLCLEHSY